MGIMGSQWTNDLLKLRLNDGDNGGCNDRISGGQIVGRHDTYINFLTRQNMPGPLPDITKSNTLEVTVIDNR